MQNRNNLRHNVHPMTFIILNIIFILAIVLINKTSFNILIVLLTMTIVFINNSNNSRKIILVTIYFIPIALSYCLTNYLFKLHLSSNVLINLISRIFAIYFSSILFSWQINFEDLIHYLMRKYNLSVKIGYPLISAVNSLVHFVAEFNRLKFIYKMQYLKTINYFRILPNLFISAARFAYYNAISFSIRQLNQNKTYIRPLVKFHMIDLIIIIIITIFSIVFSQII
jgi:hypothetical protein